MSSLHVTFALASGHTTNPHSQHGRIKEEVCGGIDDVVLVDRSKPNGRNLRYYEILEPVAGRQDSCYPHSLQDGTIRSPILIN